MHAEFVDKGTDEPFSAAVQNLQKVRLGLRLVEGVARVLKVPLYLLVQFRPVRYYQHPWIREVAANVVCKPHHRQGLATTLRMPNHAARLFRQSLAAGLQRVILVWAHYFLHPCIEHYSVANEKYKRLLVEEAQEAFYVRQLRSNLLSVVLPVAPELLRCANRRILETRVFALVGIVLWIGGDGELHGSEEGRNDVTLVRQALPYALVDGDERTLEFYDREGDAVDVNNYVWAGMSACHRVDEAYFLCEGEPVVKGMLEVDVHHILLGLARSWSRLCAADKQIVERSTMFEKVGKLCARQGGGLEKILGGSVYLKWRISFRVKECPHFALDDVRVPDAAIPRAFALGVLEVAEVVVVETIVIPHHGDYGVLILAFLFFRVVCHSNALILGSGLDCLLLPASRGSGGREWP